MQQTIKCTELIWLSQLIQKKMLLEKSYSWALQAYSLLSYFFAFAEKVWNKTSYSVLFRTTHCLSSPEKGFKNNRETIHLILVMWKESFSFSSVVRVTSSLIFRINCQNWRFILEKFFLSFFLLFLLAEIASITKIFIFVNSDDFCRSDSII